MSTQIGIRTPEVINTGVYEKSIKAAFNAGFTEEIADFIEQLPESGMHPLEAIHFAYRVAREISRIPGVESRVDELKGVAGGAGRVMLRYSGSGIREVDISAFEQSLPLNVRVPIQNGIADVFKFNNNAPELQIVSVDHGSNSTIEAEGFSPGSSFNVIETAPIRIVNDRVGADEIFADPEVAQHFAGDVNEILEGPEQISKQIISDEDNSELGITIDANFLVMTKEAISMAETPEDVQELYNISFENGDKSLVDECFKKALMLMTKVPNKMADIERLAELRYLTNDPIIQNEMAVARDRQLVKLVQSLYYRGEFERAIELIGRTTFYTEDPEFIFIANSILEDSLSKI